MLITYKKLDNFAYCLIKRGFYHQYQILHSRTRHCVRTILLHYRHDSTESKVCGHYMKNMYDSKTKAPFTRERNRSVPSSFQFLERKNRLFTRERNDCVSVFVPVHTGTQSFRSTVFLFSPCQFFQQQLHPCMRLGQKSYRSVFWTSLAPHCLFTRERNGTIAYRSTFRITYFIVPLFGTERCYFKRSRVNATPERSIFRNRTIWNGTIAFPCELGLNTTTTKCYK